MEENQPVDPAGSSEVANRSINRVLNLFLTGHPGISVIRQVKDFESPDLPGGVIHHFRPEVLDHVE
jgi:hypothetical protein